MVVGERTEEVNHTVYSVANLVTVLRLLLVPFFFSALLRDTERSRLAAFALYTFAASTDWVDGQIARRTHTVTQIGKIIDPLVDRLLLASGVIGLYVIGVLPVWIPIVLIARDVYLLWGSYRLERHHILIPVTWLGKATTAVLFTGFASLIAGWPKIPGARLGAICWLPGTGTASVPLGMWFVYIGIVMSLSAAVGYRVRAKRALDAATKAG